MERKKCPCCGEEIAATAKKCRFCGEWLTDAGGGVTPAKGFFETYFVDPYVRRYADFSGYTATKEFWLTYLAVAIITTGLGGLALLISASGGTVGMTVAIIIMSLVSLALIIPGLAISVRRLRDAGFSPWFMLLSLIPGVGALALLVMFCLPSKQPYEQPSASRFDTTDAITTAVCIALIIAGLWMSVKSMGSAFGSDYDNSDLTEDYNNESYDDPDDDRVVEPAEEASAYEEGDAAIDASGSYKGTGKVDGKYPVRIQMRLTSGEGGYYITGKYAYESTISKYGDRDSSWFPIKGKLDEISGILTLTTYKPESSEPLEEFRAEISDYYSGEIDAAGTMTNVNTGHDYTLSFECRYMN